MPQWHSLACRQTAWSFKAVLILQVYLLQLPSFAVRYKGFLLSPFSISVHGNSCLFELANQYVMYATLWKGVAKKPSTGLSLVFEPYNAPYMPTSRVTRCHTIFTLHIESGARERGPGETTMSLGSWGPGG